MIVMMAVLRLLLLRVLRFVMWRMLVVLAQQVEAVVVAVRRPHDSVDVEFGRLRVGQEHTGVVVELNERHRTLHPVIEGAVFGKSTDPAEMSVGQMALDLGEARTARAFRQYDEVFFDQIHQFAPL